MKKQLVSIILPIYNVEKYICQCIDSILQQTYTNIEIILVDDGSPDKCPRICDEYAKKDKRIRVIHKKNGGLVSAWMRGIEESSNQAEYMVFIDPDDWVSIEYIECLVNTQEKTGAEIVVASIMTVCLEYSRKVKMRAEAKVYDKETLSNELYPILLNAGGFEERGVPTSRCSKLIKKQLILKNICYCNTSTTYSEDLNIIFPVLLDAKSIAIIDDERCMYYYRYNPSSMLNSYDKNMLSSIEHVHPALLKACSDKKKEQLIPQVYADFLAASVQYYKNELLNPKGFGIARRNIIKYAEKEMFQEAVKIVKWDHYRKLNILIIRTMYSYNWVKSILVTGLLYFLKRIKVKWLKKRCNKDKRLS